MADVIIGDTKCVVLQCGNCGVFHAVPEIKYNSARREGGWWWCPNGHQRGWQKGEEQEEIGRLRRERDRLKQQAAQKDDEIAAQQLRAIEAEKKLAKSRKRALAALCPCCNRSFSNVAKHIKSKHPNVVPLEQKASNNG